MKKAVFILGVLVMSISLQSCTDESERIEENAKFEQQLIEKDTKGNPGGTGQGEDDDNGEG